jgi:hypothetical protein
MARLFQNMTWLLLEGSFENEKQQLRIWVGKKKGLAKKAVSKLR